MDESLARAMIRDHFDASNISVAGGGPDDDIARASEIYADDAVLEWPQGGERIRGKANIIAFRSAYPTRQEFQLHRTTGCHDLWVNEYTIRYDDRPMSVVGIMEFRDGKVARERIYFGEPWEPPAWRAQWVERMEPPLPPKGGPVSARKAVVERYFDGWRRSDHEQILACLTEDVVWDIVGYKHLEGADAYDAEIDNPDFVGSPQLDVERMVEEGDVVVATGTGAATQADGARFHFAFCDVFVFSGELVRGRQSYVVPLTAPV